MSKRHISQYCNDKLSALLGLVKVLMENRAKKQK